METGQSNSTSAAVANSAVYKELCAGLRYTDDISIKLLALTPLLIGAAIGTALVQGQLVYSNAVYYFALFGATISLGVFRWELRNIKSSNYFLYRIRLLEDKCQYVDNQSPTLVGSFWRIGKTEAEKLIYFVATGSWLALPYIAYMACASSSNAKIVAACHQVPIPKSFVAIAPVIFVLLIFSVFAETRYIPAGDDKPQECHR